MRRSQTDPPAAGTLALSARVLRFCPIMNVVSSTSMPDGSHKRGAGSETIGDSQRDVDVTLRLRVLRARRNLRAPSAQVGRNRHISARRRGGRLAGLRDRQRRWQPSRLHRYGKVTCKQGGSC